MSAILALAMSSIWATDAPVELSDRLSQAKLAQGATEPLKASESHVACHPVRYMRALVTAYYPGPECCGPNCNGFTSIGVDTRTTPYGIAVDSQLLRYHSKIRVPGYMTKTFPGVWWDADDTGATLRHDAEYGTVHVDVRFKTLKSATAWGARWMVIEVIDP